MEGNLRATKFQFNESKNSIARFWAVIIVLDIFVVLISQFADFNLNITGFGDGINGISLVGINILPIIVYLTVYNYDIYYKSFPVALSFSVIRKDFFKSMVLSNLLVAFIFSVIQSILMKLDPILVKFVGKEPIYDFKAFNLQTDSVIFIIVYFFIAFILLMSIWNLIAVLNYKFGAKLWIVLGIITLASQTIFKTNILSELLLPGNWLNMRLDTNLFIISFIIIIFLYIAIYFVTINTDIKNKA